MVSGLQFKLVEFITCYLNPTADDERTHEEIWHFFVSIYLFIYPYIFVIHSFVKCIQCLILVWFFFYMFGSVFVSVFSQCNNKNRIENGWCFYLLLYFFVDDREKIENVFLFIHSLDFSITSFLMFVLSLFLPIFSVVREIIHEFFLMYKMEMVTNQPVNTM